VTSRDPIVAIEVDPKQVAQTKTSYPCYVAEA
jgi:hypothetical protein